MEQGTSTSSVHGMSQAVLTVGCFAVLSALLYAVDFVPERPTAAVAVASQADVYADTEAVRTLADLPESTDLTRVRVLRAGIDAPILRPESTELAVLDRALLSGAVLYPGSGTPGRQGNILIFGHSSYLPTVRNKAFQIFNELGTLAPGDTVVLESATHEYHYRVKLVKRAQAAETPISFESNRSLVTLVTCNTFGDKGERFVVEADFERKEPQKRAAAS